MPTPERAWEVLSRRDAVMLLTTAAVGRVVFTAAGLPAVVPVTFAVSGDAVVMRTTVGSRLAHAAGRGVLAFEADEVDRVARTAWSVVVVGTADSRHRRQGTGSHRGTRRALRPRRSPGDLAVADDGGDRPTGHRRATVSPQATDRRTAPESTGCQLLALCARLAAGPASRRSPPSRRAPVPHPLQATSVLNSGRTARGSAPAITSSRALRRPVRASRAVAASPRQHVGRGEYSCRHSA